MDGLRVVVGEPEPELAPIRLEPAAEVARDSSLDAARGIGLGIVLGALCWVAVFGAAAAVLAS